MSIISRTTSNSSEVGFTVLFTTPTCLPAPQLVQMLVMPSIFPAKIIWLNEQKYTATPHMGFIVTAVMLKKPDRNIYRYNEFLR
jgi:hypothetical protein